MHAHDDYQYKGKDQQLLREANIEDDVQYWKLGGLRGAKLL